MLECLSCGNKFDAREIERMFFAMEQQLKSTFTSQGQQKDLQYFLYLVQTGSYNKLQQYLKRDWHQKSLEDRSDEEDVTGKIVVITGANAGIGKVIALQMAKRSATVVMACRNLVKAEAVINEIKQTVLNPTLILVKLDLGDLESVRNCAKEIRDKVDHINILINNAGYYGVSNDLQRTKDGFEMNLGTNHLGHVLLTHLLMDLVKKGAPSRIVVVGSLAHENAILNVDDINMEIDTRLGFGNTRPYNNSKLCNMLFAKTLAKRLEGENVNTYTLCPGLVNTDLFAGMPRWQRLAGFSLIMASLGCEPEQSAETILYCALSTKCSQESGRAYRFGRPWKEADENLKDELAEKVWEVSEKLVGITGSPPQKPPSNK
ncbi:unnamed protein product [Allacma fusca]|uniref:Protochlorophyllide reductase n=1 Tax=Allacma fusca TaxID=39272 RepID=A0A8J2KNJ2_9HEXA|nr:unnamed protein product [Allacma fusca]